MAKVTAKSLTDLYNEIVGEDNQVKSFKSVGMARERIAEAANNLEEMSLELLEKLNAAGIEIEEADADDEPKSKSKKSKAKKEKPKKEPKPPSFRGMDSAHPDLVKWFTDLAPKRGEFGNHCHDRVYQALIALQPATREQLAEYAGTKPSVAQNAIHDFRNGDNNGNYHTADGEQTTVYTRRFTDDAGGRNMLYALDPELVATADDEDSENEEAAAAAMEAAES